MKNSATASQRSWGLCVVFLFVLPSGMALVPLTLVSKYVRNEKRVEMTAYVLREKLNCTNCVLCVVRRGKDSLIHFIHL